MKRPELLRNVQWKDLTGLSFREKITELSLSAPWLLASLALARSGWYIPALICSFMFFLTGLRQVHNGFHLTLGLGRCGTDIFLALMSVAMLASMHAVKYNHLEHHRHCLKDHDVEGSVARLSFWKALLFGPVFPFLIHGNALKNAPQPLKKWVLAELFAMALCWVIALYFGGAVLWFHFFAMLAGEFFSAFFAVWTVHHDCDGEEVIGRTLRGRWKSRLSYNMFYHVEHHLFPGVPTCHLPRLAERIDAVLPEIREKTVV